MVFIKMHRINVNLVIIHVKIVKDLPFLNVCNVKSNHLEYLVIMIKLVIALMDISIITFHYVSSAHLDVKLVVSLQINV